jgi:hypothetical protein
MATGEEPTGPRAPRQRRPARLSSTSPPATPLEDVEQTPPNSPLPPNSSAEDKHPRVADPSKLYEGRTVPTKQSNRPFLA